MIPSHINPDEFIVGESNAYSCIVIPEHAVGVSVARSGEDSSIVLSAMRDSKHAISVYLTSIDAIKLSKALLECISEAMSYGSKGFINNAAFVIEDKFVALRKIHVMPDAEKDSDNTGTLRLKISNASIPGKKAAVSRMILTLSLASAIELQRDLLLVALERAEK